MPHLAHPLLKIRNGLDVASWPEVLSGLANLARIKLLRPREVEIVLKGGLKLRFNYPEQMPTVLVLFGDYIDPEYNYLKSVVRPGDFVVDVGAGIGQFTLPMARLGAAVDAWEPIPANITMLTRNLVENGAGSEVVVHPLAMADHCNGVVISDNGLLSSVGQGSTLYKSLTLDDAYPTARMRVLKVDTAGGEEKVLAGGIDLLREKRAQYLVILLSDPLIEMLPLIESWGYQFFFWNPKTRKRQLLHNLSRAAILDGQDYPARQIMAYATA